mgnify:CR=1 FL=1
MKKLVLVLMLLSAMSLQAQKTSRIMIGLGGGLTTNMARNEAKNTCGPMGAFNFGYTILGNVGNDGAQMGFRTGLNATYTKFGSDMQLSEAFSNVDYYGHRIDYRVSSKNVLFRQQQLNLELPIMLAIVAKGLYFNLGAKLMLPVMKSYNQTMEDPQISAFYPEYGVTVVNDVTTGLITENQRNFSGTPDMPKLLIGLSAEIGHVWQLGESKNSLGFDVFLDIVPWGVGGGTIDNAKSVVEVAPIVNDCEQPKAAVTVNPLNYCNNYKCNLLNFGVKLVYTFDIEAYRSFCRL